MRIVCISASQVPSSTANSIQVMKACHALAEIDHEPILLVPGQRTVPWHELRSYYGLEKAFDVQWIPSINRLRRYDFSLKAVRKGKNTGAELIYTWVLQAAVIGLASGYPVILEMHGPPEGKFGPALFRLFLRLRGKKRCLVITHALANMLQQDYHYDFPSSELVIAPNGVDLERYADLPSARQARHELNLPEQVTAGYTGHLYPGRGMNLLVELARQLPEIHFLWVGGREEDIRQWQDKLDRDGISNVTLTGFIPNSLLPRYQAASDILLMPYERIITGSSGGNSADYCSPMKMFEYMATGRAIISSDLPAIGEVLNRTNSVLCPPEDVHAWQAALVELLLDPDRRHTLAQQAMQDVAAFTWQERARKGLEGFLSS